MPPRFALRAGLDDLEYAPFGQGWLRGITPVRFGVFLLLCLVPAIIFQHREVGRWGVRAELLVPIVQWWMYLLAGGMPGLLLVVRADRLTRWAAPRKRLSSFAVAVTLTGVLYGVILSSIDRFIFGSSPTLADVLLHAYRAVAFTALLAAVCFFSARERDTSRRLMQARLRRVVTERQAAEARLQLLYAQIEPHFLFNSLASVKRLYERHPSGGRSLLRNLASYLRAAVDHGRRRDSTLGEELELANAFLAIFRLRMGERLRVTIEVPGKLTHARVPSLMLGTLVENAVKHGIGPRGSGGHIAIRARSAGDALEIEVEDDGVGFTAKSGHGVGLANTRARLQALYGERGRVDLAPATQGGVVARLRLPLEWTEGSPAPRPAQATGALAARAEQGFWQRFGYALTWRHWAWAVGAGVAYSVLDRIRVVYSPVDVFGVLWLQETIYLIACASMYMMAVVACEAWKAPPWRPGGLHYTAGFCAASLFCLVYAGTYPFDWRPASPAADPLFAFRAQVGFDWHAMYVLEMGLSVVLQAALAVFCYVWLRKSRDAESALTEAEIARTEAERRLLQSRVEAVHAEVDPSLVFESLQSLEDTYERDRDAADRMLDELIAFLRAAIPKVREADRATA